MRFRLSRFLRIVPLLAACVALLGGVGLSLAQTGAAGSAGGGAVAAGATAVVVAPAPAVAPAPSATITAAPSAPAGSSSSNPVASASVTVPASANATAGSSQAPAASPPAAPAPADAADTASPKEATSETADKSESQEVPADSKAVRDTDADQTEFQRFVRQATGQSLPLFGYELFSRGAFTATQGASVPASYVLGPGDELVVQSFGLVDFTERLVVDREGRVLVPKAGPLTLAGVRLADAERVLTAHLSKIYRNFRLSVTMGRVRSTEIFVVGQARRPGKHIVSGLSTVINALFETGGPNAIGSLRHVELRRGGRTVAQVDLYRFLAFGESAGDARLEPGDVIVIPPAGPRAAVLGTVNVPSIYELKPGESIESVLALSGGLPVLASPQKAQLERVNPANDVARYVEDFALDAAGLAKRLQAGDVLTVFQISPQIADVVTLQGNVASPMRYTWRQGMRVSDLVTGGNMLVPVQYWLRVNAGSNIPGLDRPEVNLDYATIQRLDPKTLRTTVIPFHLAKALRGDPVENVLLSPGDLVRVYGPQEAGAEGFGSVSLRASFNGSLRRFAWRQGFRVTDVIPDVAWLQEEVNRWVRRTGGTPLQGLVSDQVNLDYAVIRRYDAKKLRTELIAFDLGKALSGSVADNPVLEPGDQVSVFSAREAGPDAFNSISLKGEALGGERRFVWRPGSKVTDVIPDVAWLQEEVNRWVRRTGGTPIEGYAAEQINLDYAVIRRYDPQRLRSELIAFNLEKALAGSLADNLTLRPGDQISLYSAREAGPETLNSVTIRGEVLGGERRFVWRPGFSIRDIIPDAEWLVTRYNYWRRASGQELRNDINWDYAQVIRRVDQTLQTRALTFNLGGAVLQRRPQDNLELQPGDRIALFTTRELPVPMDKRLRLVTLSGEVKVPGVYQVASGETLGQIIQRAGGFTSDAYVFGLEFRRESIRAVQQQNLDRIIQKLEMEVRSDAQTRLQNITSADQAQAAQSALRADELRMASLRQLKATGRVALGLEAERVELPGLALEDGDTVMVPPRPAFVGVFGAVNNENALIWRLGMTVGDAIDRAGPTRFADPSLAYVLRADGTVQQAQSRLGFLGFGGVRRLTLQPGDTVVVPEKPDRETLYSTFIRGAKDLTAILYQFGLGAAALKTLRN